MISSYTLKELNDAIRSLNIPENSSILTSVQLFSLGLAKDLKGKSKDIYHKAHFETIFNSLSPGSTLVANTFTVETGYKGVPFIWESNETTTGYFNQLILEHPDRQRSLHPFHSISAIGPQAEIICNPPRKSNYGLGSAYDVLLNLPNTYILRIGIDPFFNSFFHHAECLIGVPYCYLKTIDIPVYKENKIIAGPWYGYVRYTHFDINYDFSKLENILIQSKIISQVKLGAGTISYMRADSYVDIVKNCLISDPFFVLDPAPLIPQGKVPRDGIIDPALRERIKL